MKHATANHPFKTLAVFIFIGAVAFTAPRAFAHGGKPHQEHFTTLQAVKKATTLYDKLIESGKLAESWETDLETVTISRKARNGKPEIVIGFHRHMGDPGAVYIFLDANDRYTGSNFTGE